MENTKTNSYKDLIVWQKSIGLVIVTYRFTKTLPKEELYGLVSQMRRDSVSIPSNIAEGYARGYTKEFVQFLSTANASAAELDTQLIICTKLELGNKKLLEDVKSILVEVQKLIPAVIKGIKRKLVAEN